MSFGVFNVMSWRESGEKVGKFTKQLALAYACNTLKWIMKKYMNCQVMDYFEHF
jgi:hypothetical protein